MVEHLSAPEQREAAERAAFRPLDHAVTIRSQADVEALARAIDQIRYARSPRRNGRESLPYDDTAEVPHVVVRDLVAGLRALNVAVPDAAEAGELREEVAYWRRDAAARLWSDTALLKTARRDGRDREAEVRRDHIRTTCYAVDAVRDKRWHTSCEACEEPILPGQATASTDDAGPFHARCILEDLYGIADGPDDTGSDLDARVMAGREVLAADDALWEVAQLRPAGAEVLLDYTNHRGERSTRTVIPTGRLLPGDDTYHPGARWVVEAWDVKGAMRTFDPAHIHAWGDQRPRDVAPAASPGRAAEGEGHLAGVEAALDALVISAGLCGAGFSDTGGGDKRNAVLDAVRALLTPAGEISLRMIGVSCSS